MMTFLRYLQGFLSCLLLALACAFTIKGYQTMEEAQAALKRAAGEAEHTMFHVQQSADAVAVIAIRTEKITRPLAWIGGGFKKIGKTIKRIF